MMKAIRLARVTFLPPLMRVIKPFALAFLLPAAGIYAMVYIAVNFGERIVESTGGPVSFVVGFIIAPFVYLLNILAVLFVVAATILGSVSLSPFAVIIILLVLILMKLNQTS